LPRFFAANAAKDLRLFFGDFLTLALPGQNTRAFRRKIKQPRHSPRLLFYSLLPIGYSLLF
jgi:hypothetical protein